jgi:hypothetical protein
MDVSHIVIAVEDSLSEAVVKRLLREYGNQAISCRVMGNQGVGWLKARTQQFLNASKSIPHIVLIDLDTGNCAPGLLQEWFGRKKSPYLLVRVAVREVEAWLLADRSGFARFAGTTAKKLPLDADSIADPKQYLINVFRSGKKQRIASEIVPEIGSTAKVGFGYNRHLCRFVEEEWSVDNAIEHSASLRRTVIRLREFLS